MRSTCALLALLLGCHDPAPTEAPTPATQTEAASAKKRPAPRSAGPNLHALPLTRAEAQLSRYAETQRETHLVRAAAAAETTVREGERHDYARFLLALIRNEQGRSEDSQVLRDQTPQDRRHFWSRYFAQGLAPALPYLAANVARACAASADKLGDTCQPHDAVAPPADYAAFEQASRIRTSRNRLASWGPDTASMTLPQLFSTLDIQPGQDVVDLGAGDGWFAVPLARYLGSGTLWANEIDDGLVDYLGFAASYHELPNLVPVRGSATDLGVEPASVDLVFASDVLSLVYSQGQDPKPLLASIQRSLRPGGRLLILDAASAKDADRGLDADRLAADLLATGLTATEAPPLQLTAGRIVLVFRKG